MIRWFQQYKVTESRTPFDKLAQEPGRTVDFNDPNLMKEEDRKTMIVYGDLLDYSDKFKLVDELYKSFDPCNNKYDAVALRNVLGQEFDPQKTEEVMSELRAKVHKWHDQNGQITPSD